jgi:hypothetical protein
MLPAWKSELYRTASLPAQWEDKTGDVWPFLDKPRAPGQNSAPTMPVCQ